MEQSRKQLLHGSRPQRPQQRGLTVLWIIVFFIILLSFGAIALEMAWLRVNQTRAQTAAEAASLAAVGVLSDGRDQALSESIMVAGANEGAEGPVILTGAADNSGGDLRFGRWDPTTRTFEPALLAPNAAEVTVRLTENHANGPVPLIFGGLMGFGHVNVSARAMAHRSPKLPVPVSLWVQENLQPRAVFLKSSSDLEVNGTILIQSTSSKALTAQGGSMLRATMIGLEGGIAVDSDHAIHGMLNEEPEPADLPAVPDFSLHSLPQQLSLTDAPGAYVLPPGYYPNGLVASLGRYMLNDGVFLFGGPGIELSGAARISSRNAVIFLDEGTHLEVNGAGLKLYGAAEINDVDNRDLIVLAAAPGATPELLFTDARIAISGMVHFPGSTLDAHATFIRCTKMAVNSLTLEHESTATMGEEDPHPIDLLLVQ